MLMTFSGRIPAVKNDYEWYNFNSFSRFLPLLLLRNMTCKMYYISRTWLAF